MSFTFWGQSAVVSSIFPLGAPLGGGTLLTLHGTSREASEPEHLLSSFRPRARAALLLAVLLWRAAWRVIAPAAFAPSGSGLEDLGDFRVTRASPALPLPARLLPFHAAPSSAGDFRVRFGHLGSVQAHAHTSGRNVTCKTPPAAGARHRTRPFLRLRLSAFFFCVLLASSCCP